VRSNLYHSEGSRVGGGIVVAVVVLLGGRCHAGNGRRQEEGQTRERRSETQSGGASDIAKAARLGGFSFVGLLLIRLHNALARSPRRARTSQTV